MQGLQANILKGHGREHVALLFLQINHLVNARAFLRAYPASDAFTQHQETVNFKVTRAPGGVVRLVFISKAGLDKLGHAALFGGGGGGGVFAQPMSADPSVLDQGSTDFWQAELKEPVDVLLLVAYHNATDLTRIVSKMVGDFSGSVEDNPAIEAARPFKLLFVQEGRAYKNADGEGVEHFGYVDGRSQPLMLKSAIDEEAAGGGIDVYDPSSPLKQFVLPDPLHPAGHGSFFVFRKLEQNVAGFKAAEKALAATLGLTLGDRERAGAMAVGRFEDGTPVTLASTEMGVPVRNNFNYDADADGGKCPFHAHIRKSNPRGSSPGGKDFDKTVQMARRGITYGSRMQDPESDEFVDQPNDGVGLLFMSYQASIDAQFHFMQTAWVNNENFPRGGVGQDPLIGQSGNQLQPWFPAWGSATNPTPSLFKGFVTLKGGEYFYTPSIGGLKSI